MMTSEQEAKAIKAVANAIETFYERVIASMDKLDIKGVMKRKNPYLYKVKGVCKASEIVEATLAAFVSSSEETVFGNTFFEPLALAVSGGEKALAKGIDLIVTDKASNTVTVYAVKSGTSVYNSDSKAKQEQNFLLARTLAKQSKARFVAYVGYCYGRKRSQATPHIYQELVGKAFWAELTGDPDFYLKIIDYIGETPQTYLQAFRQSYDKAYNRLLRDFVCEFCADDGSINWERLVRFNSGD